jgi:hypothetical protein
MTKTLRQKLLKQIVKSQGQPLVARSARTNGRKKGKNPKTSTKKMVRSFLQVIRGSGDYVMSQTPVKNSLFDEGVPFMHRGTEDVRFSRREFVTDVVTQTAFVTQTYPIQPGMQNLFPYLAGIAQNFQEYEIDGMAFEFVSTSGDSVASTNQAQGTVAMAVLYDFDQSVPSSKSQFLNIGGGVDTKPSRNILCGVECDRSKSPLKTLYLRSGALPLSSAQETHDFGIFCLGTGGAQATFTCGELWVTYDIVLRKPIPIAIAGVQQNAAAFAKFTAPNYTNTHPLVGALPVGSVIGPSFFSTMANTGIATDNNGDVFSYTEPQNGYYDVRITWNGASAAAATATMPVPTVTAFPSAGSPNMTATLVPTLGLAGASTFLQSPQSGATAVTSMSQWFRFQIVGATGSWADRIQVRWPVGGSLPTGTNQMDLEIIYLGPVNF